LRTRQSRKAFERIAEDQGFKSLKFKNCKGAIFHDADWIAGVDYDENIQQEDDYDEDYDENDKDDPDEDIATISTIKLTKMN
jgi:hypothetical protein